MTWTDIIMFTGVYHIPIKTVVTERRHVNPWRTCEQLTKVSHHMRHEGRLSPVNTTREEAKLKNIFVLVVLQAPVLLAKLNNFWQNFWRARATAIHIRVLLRDKMWEGIFPVSWAFETRAAPVSHDANPPSPHQRTTLIFSPLFHPGKQQHCWLYCWMKYSWQRWSGRSWKDCVYLSVCRLHRWDLRSQLGVQGWLFAPVVCSCGGRGISELEPVQHTGGLREGGGNTSAF